MEKIKQFIFDIAVDGLDMEKQEIVKLKDEYYGEAGDMKKQIIVGVMLALVIMLVIPFVTQAAFSDVEPDAWYAGTVAKLTDLGIIGGYPDGTFNPGGQITRAEFSKILIFSVAKERYESSPWRMFLEPIPEGSHWATDVMRYTVFMDLASDTDFIPETWDFPIKRKEMAQMIIRAMKIYRNDRLIEDTAPYIAKITDWETTCEACKPEIELAYAMGIIAGLPDGSFAGENEATRAEASTMIVRLIDPSQRVKPDVEIPERIFDRERDVLPDGTMSLEASEKYALQLIDSMQFYRDADGKGYVKGMIPPVPDGFEIELSISIGPNGLDGDLILATDNVNFSPARQDPYYGKHFPRTGSFDVSIDRPGLIDNLKEVYMSIRVINPTNEGKDADGGIGLGTARPNQISYGYLDDRPRETSYYDFSKLFVW